MRIIYRILMKGKRNTHEKVRKKKDDDNLNLIPDIVNNHANAC